MVTVAIFDAVTGRALLTSATPYGYIIDVVTSYSSDNIGYLLNSNPVVSLNLCSHHLLSVPNYVIALLIR